MATEQLRQACERAEKLSLKDQGMVAKQILEAIERIEADEEWNAIWKKPKAIQLAKEAREGEKERDDVNTSMPFLTSTIEEKGH